MASCLSTLGSGPLPFIPEIRGWQRSWTIYAPCCSSTTTCSSILEGGPAKDQPYSGLVSYLGQSLSFTLQKCSWSALTMGSIWRYMDRHTRLKLLICTIAGLQGQKQKSLHYFTVFNCTKFVLCDFFHQINWIWHVLYVVDLKKMDRTIVAIPKSQLSSLIQILMNFHPVITNSFKVLKLRLNKNFACWLQGHVYWLLNFISTWQTKLS